MYDRYGEEGLRGRGERGLHHVDLSEALGIFMRDFGGFGGFEEMFGGGARGSQRSGADVKITMPLTLAEVVMGVEKKIVVKLLDPCERCEGSGAEPGTKPQRCTTCAGSGEVRRAQRSFFGQFVSVAPCPDVRGAGQDDRDPVQEVQRRGTEPRRAHDHGADSRRRGDGAVHDAARTGKRRPAAAARAATSSSLFEVEDDPRFERDGDDLYTEVLVTYAQLVLGADVQVPYITTTLSLRVPPGTQSGQVFQLRGRGLPRVNASGSGDLHGARAALDAADAVTDEQETLIARCARSEGPPPATRARGLLVDDEGCAWRLTRCAVPRRSAGCRCASRRPTARARERVVAMLVDGGAGAVQEVGDRRCSRICRRVQRSTHSATRARRARARRVQRTALGEVDWSTRWVTRVGVQRIGRIAVAPPWMSDDDRRRGDSDLIEPAMAFGTGEHETTRGVLALMQSLVAPGALVADLGSGSGVLAIAAAKLGAARVVAIEIDPGRDRQRDGERRAQRRRRSRDGDAGRRGGAAAARRAGVADPREHHLVGADRAVCRSCARAALWREGA